VGNMIRDNKAKYFGKGIENGDLSLLFGSFLPFSKHGQQRPLSRWYGNFDEKS